MLEGHLRDNNQVEAYINSPSVADPETRGNDPATMPFFSSEILLCVVENIGTRSRMAYSCLYALRAARA